jgi:hypothetical protein
MNFYPYFLLLSFCVFLMLAILANTDYGKYVSAKCRRKYRRFRNRQPTIKSINYPVVVNVASITIEGAVRPCRIAVLPNSLQITDSRAEKVLAFLPMSAIRGVAYVDRTMKVPSASINVSTTRGRFHFVAEGLFARWRMMNLAKIIKASCEQWRPTALPLIKVPTPRELTVSSILHRGDKHAA